MSGSHNQFQRIKFGKLPFIDLTVSLPGGRNTGPADVTDQIFQPVLRRMGFFCARTHIFNRDHAGGMTVNNYFVVGKRGLIGIAVMLCVCVALSVAVANRIGQAIFVDGGKRLLPIYSVDTEEKVVALGFNCAWDAADVPEILRILEENDVKATFFLVGQWAEKYPDSVKALYDAGHELGNHSFSHPDMTAKSRDEVAKQIRRCDDTIERITGTRPKLFRAPSGSYNNTVVEVAESLGHSVIQWDCDSRDWKGPSAKEMTRNVLKGVQPGSITLFHVGKANTVEALPEIIRQLKAEGYSFRPVGEMIYYEDYEIDVQGRQHKKQGSSSDG